MALDSSDTTPGVTGEARQNPGQPSLDGPPDIERVGRNAAPDPQAVAGSRHGAAAGEPRPVLDGVEGFARPESGAEAGSAERSTADGARLVRAEELLDRIRKGKLSLPATLREIDRYFAEQEQPSMDFEPQTLAVTLDPIAEVHAHYVAVMNPRRKVLDPQERALIREALKVAGDTRAIDERKAIAECKAAITGCSLSDFHMGRADASRYQGRRPKKYNKLSQILKGKKGGRTTREQIDYFVEIAESGRRETSVPSELNANIVQAKKAVWDAWEFPTDEHLQERRERAEAWLLEHGISVERDPSTNEPTFVDRR